MGKMGLLNVIGLGYIGLPTALMFAANGLEVVGTDLNENIVRKLNDRELTFKEDGISDLFEKALNNNVEFTTKYIKTDRYIITVPTPYREKNKKIDVHYVTAAVSSVLEVCEKGTILVIESTVSPGTMDRYIRPLIESKGLIIGQDIHLVHAPERIIPGKMIYELQNNSRTIGADSQEIGMEVRTWYESFCREKIIVTDIKTAEMSKVVENTFRDVNIAFANELARICRKEEMDVYELIKIANMHPRVNILQPGPGVGGHCISVDPWFLVGDYPDIVNIILSARNVNDSMPSFVIERIREIMVENNITDISRVGLYGLTYKEDINDMRESPTIQLLQRLEQLLVKGIKSYDPWVETKILKDQCMNFDEFIDEVDLVVIMVAHKHITQNYLKLDGKVILDARNCIDVGNLYNL